MSIRIALALVAALAATPVLAQTAGAPGTGGAHGFMQGYGGARSLTGQPTQGTTRDANGNRLVVNGLIQTGASAYSSSSGGVSGLINGLGSGHGGIGSSTAIGNQLNVVVQGNWNTVIVNSTQTNNGQVTAGTELNGRLRLAGE
ncbi:holdfast anchoring protein HfaA [Brevundimonas sp. 2R-24]|uniref:Holdfast anchoring protein HfaA n=1 Tax=Peiella sedimenti TaxID=3061083 RepID=A0ABT8SIU2_9CAUL|nr:holdfast anchoring protein HfaA [Caulobacteraceae bacterium XZ-24]